MGRTVRQNTLTVVVIVSLVALLDMRLLEMRLLRSRLTRKLWGNAVRYCNVCGCKAITIILTPWNCIWIHRLARSWILRWRKRLLLFCLPDTSPVSGVILDCPDFPHIYVRLGPKMHLDGMHNGRCLSTLLLSHWQLHCEFGVELGTVRFPPGCDWYCQSMSLQCQGLGWHIQQSFLECHRAVFGWCICRM